MSCWLQFQKRMGLEYLPNDNKLCALLHSKDLHKAASASPAQHSRAAIPQTTKRPQISEAPAQSSKIPSFEYNGFNELQSAIAACPGCEAADTRRPVPTKPIQKPKVLVVTDAIDYEEELAGGYLTGTAMELLEKMLKAINIPMDQVYLTGLFKCRTGTKPKRMDVERCARFLVAEIGLLKPQAILSFTPLLSWPLLGKMASLSHLRGKTHLICINEHEMMLFFTHSPKTILKTTANTQKTLKLETWKDLQTLQEELKKTMGNT